MYMTYMSQIYDQKRFTIWEVTIDWHEPTVLQRIMKQSVAQANEQLDPRYSTQTYHLINQPHKAFTPYPLS